MIRTVKFSLKYLTSSKQRQLEALRRELYSTTNKFVESLWAIKGKLDKSTMDRISGGSLSYRHKSNCLKQALEVIVFTRKASKTSVRSPRVLCFVEPLVLVVWFVTWNVFLDISTSP